MPDTGNEAQMRIMLDQVAEAAATNMAMKLKAQQFDQPREAPVPPLIKWLVGAIAALGSAALVGLGIWLVSTVSAVQVTLARMDERMTAGAIRDNRVDPLERRLTRLEAYHSEGE